MTREPGDLPAIKGNTARSSGDGSPVAVTEVEMAAKTIAQSAPLSLSARVQAGILSLLVGAFLVWGAGLANSAALHDTAHDTRHGYGFPCH